MMPRGGGCLSRLSDTLNTFDDYDLTFLGEPVQVAANVKDGFRTGIIALTDTRLVFICRKKCLEFIDREFYLDAIGSSTLEKHLWSWQLSVNDHRTSSIFVGQRDGLEPFVESLRQITERNALHTVGGHDITIVGEPVLLAAKGSGGWRDGVIVLTETRLVYLRKDTDQTFIDRESDRAAIANVTYTKSLGTRTLEFKDGSSAISYTQTNEDLEPFVGPLRQSAEENQAKRNETEADELEAIVGEPIKQMCKARDSGDWMGGTIALTSTRLVYLNPDNGTSTVKHQTALNAITKARLVKKDGLNVLHLRAGIWYISYQSINQNSEALSPIFKALVPIAEHNEKILAHSIAEAEERHREEAAKREAEKRARAEAQTTRPESFANAKPIPIGELKKLAELKDLGIVTEDEFELKKNQILGIQKKTRNQINYPELNRRRASRTAYDGHGSNTGDWGWKRWGCISAVVVVALLLLLLVCTPNDGYDCERQGDRLFGTDAGVNDVLEFMERCEY